MPPAPARTVGRVASLDVFRGLTMAAMVIVNNPGDWEHVYPPLLHADWHGWTPTDLIFPAFLFIVGVTLTWSRSHASWTRLLRRTLVLIGLGLALGAFPFFHVHFATMRVPGVLQRIGLCYFAAAIVLRRTSSVASLLALAAALTVGYWGMLFFPPGAGDLSPAGNLGARLDRALLGGHLWKADSDPEGLLTTIPAVATTLLGAATGMFMRSVDDPRRLVVALCGAGLSGIAVGLFWNELFPINKNLWTSSYVFLTAGIAVLVLAACYALIDAWPSTVSRLLARPFIVLGTNALLLYVLSTALASLMDAVVVGDTTVKGRLYDRWFTPLGSPYNASLMFAVAYLAAMFIVLLPLYRRSMFLRV